MENYSQVYELLSVLCRANGVSGAEDDAAETAKALLSRHMHAERDTLGNVIGTQGEGRVHILLDAHIDRIGLIVTSIDETGFLKVAKCGGADVRVLAASQVTVHGRQELFGVITSTPPHLSGSDDSGKAKSIDEISVDIGLAKEDAEKLVSRGDRISFRGEFRRLQGNRLASPYIDDSAGVAAILRCLELLEGVNHGCKITVMFSAQEETGGSGAQTGAYSINADEAIAVDVSFASQPTLSGDKYASLGGGAMVGYSPVLDYAMSRKLSAIAQDKKIPAQSEIMGGRTGTNCDNIQTVAGGVRTALISVPLRNMHTPVEICDLEDIESTAKLMAEYIIERGAFNA